MLLNEHLLSPRNERKGARPWKWQWRVACTGVFILATTAAMAQEPTGQDGEEVQEVRRYSVEIIVFSYADSQSAGSEIFIPDPVENPVETLVEEPAETLQEGESLAVPTNGAIISPETDLLTAQDPDAETIPEFGDLLVDFEDQELVEIIAGDRIDLQVMMPDELTMIDIHDKLVLLDAYEPVMWGGWTQVVLPEAETPSIRIRRLGNLPLAFDGNLKLYLSRFLHLIIDITMDGESPVPEGPVVSEPFGRFDRGFLDEFGDPIYATAPSPMLHYRILENRIVKSEDIRYFDHPKFGVLAKISRYEMPDDQDGLEDGEKIEEESDPPALGAQQPDDT